MTEFEIGQRIGRLTVLGRSNKRTKDRNRYWELRCDCGTIVVVRAVSLRIGSTLSCGCLRLERVKERARGLFNDPEYRRMHSVWKQIIRRCSNPKSKSYHLYGARGIRVCERWKNFDAFREDMGQRPGPRYTVERIDNDGDYCPDNCRWATYAEQARNKRYNVWIERDGVRLVAADWERKTGIPAETITRRYRQGLPLDQVFRPTGRS